MTSEARNVTQMPLELTTANAIPGRVETGQEGAPSSLIRDEDLFASKIMIVDDEPINVKLARKLLMVEGYANFVTTTDSREAIVLISKESPDALLLDVMMPHLSGLDILAALRADARWLHLPIVILTATSDQAIKRQAIDLGVTDFLAKPVDATDLVPRIRNV